MSEAANEPMRPNRIYFCPSGITLVDDADGCAMPQYERVSHAQTIAALAVDGIDWWTIPCCSGEPQDAMRLTREWFTGAGVEDVARLMLLFRAGWNLGRILELVQAVRDGDAEPSSLGELARIWEGTFTPPPCANRG